MHKLQGVIKNYEWGSKSFIHQILGVSSSEPIAEYWLGAHASASSTCEGKMLVSLVQDDPDFWLGKAKNLNMGKFPFLLKILSAESPLSIQVHPSKEQAINGFQIENAQGVSLDSPKRNFKDECHKPEMMLALTSFTALCGFREYSEIIELFQAFDIGRFFSSFAAFKDDLQEESFRMLYLQILQNGGDKAVNKHVLRLNLPENSMYIEVLDVCKMLLSHYPEDQTALSPVLMNVVDLEPFSALYLDARVPHAYLRGSGVEIMASSDNVLRGGLTPKNVDIKELLSVVCLAPKSPRQINPILQSSGNYLYLCPVEEFMLYMLDGSSMPSLPTSDLPKIMLCLEGQFCCQDEKQEIIVRKGEALVVAAKEEMPQIEGNGLLIVALPNIA